MGQNQCTARLHRQHAAELAGAVDGGKGGFGRLELKYRQRFVGSGFQHHFDAKGRGQRLNQIQELDVAPLCGRVHGGAVHQIAGFVAAGNADRVAAVGDVDADLVDIAVDYGLAVYQYLARLLRAQRPSDRFAADVFGAGDVKSACHRFDAAADRYRRPTAVLGAAYLQNNLRHISLPKSAAALRA